jgi:hypothetical protein
MRGLTCEPVDVAVATEPTKDEQTFNSEAALTHNSLCNAVQPKPRIAPRD